MAEHFFKNKFLKSRQHTKNNCEGFHFLVKLLDTLLKQPLSQVFPEDFAKILTLLCIML